MSIILFDVVGVFHGTHLLTEALAWILKEKFEVEGIDKIDSLSDATLQNIHFHIPQILEEFRKPEVILGILEKK